MCSLEKLEVSELVFLRDFSVVLLVFFSMYKVLFSQNFSFSLSDFWGFLLSLVSVPPAAVFRCDYHTRITEV